jgi:hypothetical protein
MDVELTEATIATADAASPGSDADVSEAEEGEEDGALTPSLCAALANGGATAPSRGAARTNRPARKRSIRRKSALPLHPNQAPPARSAPRAAAAAAVAAADRAQQDAPAEFTSDFDAGRLELCRQM